MSDPMFSQYGIEAYLDKIFKEPGTFLEIGCWDGERISQTAWLEWSRGWRGLCVDPFAVHFEERRCMVCRKAVSGDGKPRKFIKVSIDRRDEGDVSYFSGFKDRLTVHWPLIEQFCDYEEIELQTISMEQLYEQYSLPSYIEFLSVDTEGSELEIFESIDFERFRFGLIAYEHNGNEAARKRIDEILQGNGYRLLERLSSEDDLYIFEHKVWLDNEYLKWIEALQESTVYNFKENLMVQRMLGTIDPELFWREVRHIDDHLLYRIDFIGKRHDDGMSGVCMRMMYYAEKVLARNPTSIVEIGGGVGQFYAVLRAMGYRGSYMILDLPEVQHFQVDYLAAVMVATGLDLTLTPVEEYEMCVSFYALGEFDDALKRWYVENVVKKCAHGFILWNPHSGASSEIPFECAVSDEFPLLHPGNKQLTW